MLAQIERAKERMKEKILPSFFEERLAYYEDRKKRSEYVNIRVSHNPHYFQRTNESTCNSELVAKYPKGLSGAVIQRLESLKFIEKDLEENGDINKQLPNVKSLIKAYESKRLKWVSGKVTKWYQGKCVDRPRDLDWDEVHKVASQLKAHDSFWLEGVCFYDLPIITRR